MRKRKVLFLGRPYIMVASFVFLLMPVCCWSAPEQLSSVQHQAPSDQWQLAIDGPHEIIAGELVVLTVGQSTNPDVPIANDSQHIGTQFRWQVLPPESTSDTFRVCDDGRTLVFASRQIGCYHFVLAASDGETLQMVTHTLLNIGETPKPVPLPPPDLTPEPLPQPEPQNEFASLYDWAAQKTGSLVRSDHFVREKTALAESLAEVSTQVRQGKIKTCERARVELRVLTRRKLESISRRSTTVWQAWETELARQLSQLEQAGKLETPEQLQTAFNAIADGLLAEQNVSTTTKGDAST